MCGGGGSTTNTTNTGLGDEQHDELVAGQGTIRADIDSFGDEAETRYNSTMDEFGEMADANDDRFDDVDNSLYGIGNSVNAGFADVATGQTELATSVDTRLDATDQNLTTGFDNITNTVNTGVGTVTNAVDTRAGEINTNIDNNFTNTNDAIGTGFTNLTDTVNTNDSVLLANQTDGFSSAKDQLTEVGTDLGDQLTDTSVNVLGGQADISALIEKYGGDAATYYADLASGQGILRDGQGTMQTAFDEFRTDFDDYSTLANQTRSDLGQTVIGGFDTMGQVLGNQAQASADGFAGVNQGVANVGSDVADVSSDVTSNAGDSQTNFGNIAASIAGVSGEVTGVGDDVADNASTSDSNFASVATEIATGFNDTSAEGSARKKSFLDTLDTVQNILQTDTGTLDANVKANYQSLISSFDDQGTLITQSASDTGNTFTRAMSDQGELFIAEFDAAGVRVGQQTLDINALMNNVTSFEANMGTQFNTIFGDAEAAAQGRSDILSAFTVTNGLIGDTGTGLGQQFDDELGALQSAFDAQGSLIRSEITETGSELRRDLDSQGNLITTEFSQTGEIIGQTSLNISDISTQLNGMQAGLGDQITGAFSGIQQSSEELRSNLVGNLAGLRNIMTTQGDTIGADLQTKFGSLLSAFDEEGELIRSSVTENGDFIFREINENGELVVSTVDDATGQLLESDKFNAELLTTDFDSRFNSSDEFLQAIDSSIRQVGGDIDQGLLGMASGLEGGFMSRFDELSDQEREGRNEFTTRLTQVRALLEEDVADLDDGLRSRMGALSKAFDGEGRLIANAIDANGNMLKRTIDDSGNLLLGTYSRMNGQLLDQQSLDINRLMKQISDRRVTQGSNANMGGTSPTAGAPAPASVYSGFASPYAQTY